MSDKKIWSGVLPLSILIAMIGGIIGLGRIGSNINERIIENGIRSKGIVFDEKKTFIDVSYIVNGKEYRKGVPKGYSKIEDGEEFVLMYLSSDPESIVVFFEEPFFSDKYSYSDVSCISITKQLSVLKYEYEVNGEMINRNTLYRDQSLNPDNYFVRYRNENPKIGYLINK
jgi:hypothetical protein